MAIATKDQQDQDDADFAAQFDAPDAEKKQISEDEAFGLADTDPAPAAGEGEGATTDTGGADAAAAPAEATAQEPQESDAEKALREREAAVAAREAELAAKEASISTTNVGETQNDGEGSGEGGTGGSAGEDPDGDPAQLLADDFGPDFVQLLTRFIKQICKGELGEGLGSINATVDQVIHHLTSERQANHFKAIKDAHDDFMEVVDSPEFSAWKGSQAPEEQDRLQRVVDSGSAQEIIDMLTAFKQSRGNGASTVDESALDDAEGVRSGGGMSLPSEPAAADDYARAWDQA